MNFLDKLRAAEQKNRSLLCVGLDPEPARFPAGLTGDASRIYDFCARIVDAGIVMISQSVLLKGVNDDAGTLATLMRTFVENRVKPYYLHHPDLAPGTSHFRLSIEEGQALVAALRARWAAAPA